MVDTVTVKPPLDLNALNAGGDPVAAARAVDVATRSLNPPQEIDVAPVDPDAPADIAAGTAISAVEPPATDAGPGQPERQASETQRLRETITADRSRQLVILDSLDAQITDAEQRQHEMAAAIAATEQTLSAARNQADKIKRELTALHDEREQVTGRITKYSLMIIDADSAEMKRPRT